MISKTATKKSERKRTDRTAQSLHNHTSTENECGLKEWQERVSKQFFVSNQSVLLNLLLLFHQFVSNSELLKLCSPTDKVISENIRFPISILTTKFRSKGSNACMQLTVSNSHTLQDSKSRRDHRQWGSISAINSLHSWPHCVRSDQCLPQCLIHTFLCEAILHSRTTTAWSKQTNKKETKVKDMHLVETIV